MSGPRLLLLVLLGALVLLAGCGYHLPGKGYGLPDDVHTLFVAAFTSGTSEPLVENRVTNDVVTEFARGGAFEILEGERADARLDGKVTGYSVAAVSYDALDEIAEYRATMTVQAVLRRQGDDSVLWRGSVSWNEEFDSDADKAVQEDNEARAIDSVSQRIAEELYHRIIDGF